MGRTRAGIVTGVALVLLALAGCAPASAPGPAATPDATPTATPSPTVTSTATPDPLAALTLEERVGQLFMVGAPVDTASADALAAVTDRHVGAVFLHGRTEAGADAVAAVVAPFAAQRPAGAPVWIATDQEGGDVQALRGPGFEDVPYAIRQADEPPETLRQRATQWGRQLRAAGVTMNLAPVADIVTSHEARFDNPPIGALGRQYGYDAVTVATCAGAFADGMRAAGILPTFKHFPGLGHVTANTDHVEWVVDDTIDGAAPDVAVYRDLLAGGPAVVMVSSAVYPRIDAAGPAVFSPLVVTGVLRDRLGFDGVVMTDDLSAAAAADVLPVAERGIAAIAAGVDLVLVSADPSVLPEMHDAVLARAAADPAFAAQVDAAARRVLAAKRP